MELLRGLVQTVVIIVVMAVFMEMILPGGDMRRYVKMVMGLLIIVAVLQAAAGIIDKGLAQDIPQVAVPEAGPGVVPLEDILAAGNELSEINREQARQKYAEGLAKQVMSLARLNSSLQVADARVVLDEQSNKISSITIVVHAAAAGRQDDEGSGTAVNIRPVTVDVQGGGREPAGAPGAAPTPAERKAARTMAEILADFYNLPAGQVEVVFR